MYIRNCCVVCKLSGIHSTMCERYSGSSYCNKQKGINKSCITLFTELTTHKPNPSYIFNNSATAELHLAIQLFSCSAANVSQ